MQRTRLKKLVNVALIWLLAICLVCTQVVFTSQTAFGVGEEDESLDTPAVTEDDDPRPEEEPDNTVDSDIDHDLDATGDEPDDVSAVNPANSSISSDAIGDITVTFEYGYDAEDGSGESETKSITEGDTVTPPDIEREGYELLGWYQLTKSEEGEETLAEEPFDFTTKLMEDVVLRALWQEDVSDFAWYTDNVDAWSFEISTAGQLVFLAQLVDGSTEMEDIDAPVNFDGRVINLANDIDLGENDWTLPIGSGQDTPFSGTFNGAGYSLTNANMTTANSYQGLFGCVDNATIENFSLSGSAIGDNNIGLVAAYGINSAFYDLAITGTVVGTGRYTGGIVGNSINNEFKNTTMKGNVSGAAFTGGIAGYHEGSATQVSNHATVTAESSEASFTGGIIGAMGARYTTTITWAENFGAVTAGGSENASVGGIIGGTTTSYAFNLCYSANKGAISADSTGSTVHVAGLVGSTSASLRIENCFNQGSIASSAHAAGLVCSANAESTFIYCYNSGEVDGTTAGQIGGAVSFDSGCNFTYYLSDYETPSLAAQAKEVDASTLKTEAFVTEGNLGLAYLGFDGAYPELTGSGAEWEDYVLLNYRESTLYDLASELENPLGYRESDTIHAAELTQAGLAEPVVELGLGKSMFSLVAWYPDEDYTEDPIEFIDGYAQLESETTIYAKWEIASLCVSFDYDYDKDGENYKVTEHVAYGDTIDEPVSYRDGYDLLGWYELEADEDGVETLADLPFDFMTPITKNKSLRAKWQNDIATYEWFTKNRDASEFFIATAGDLFGLAKLVAGTAVIEGKTEQFNFEGRFITLSADIDLDGYVWFLPIGTNLNAPFKGAFSGAGYEVSNLLVHSGGNFQGLFGYIVDGLVSNLTVSGTVSAEAYVGGIIGYIDSRAILENLTNNVQVNGSMYVGGIVGYATRAISFIDTRNNGDITGSSGRVGGIVGNIKYEANITAFSDSENLGSITSCGQYGGGIAGHMFAEGDVSLSMKDTKNAAEVTSDDYAGGLIGGITSDNISSFEISNSHNSGNVTSADSEAYAAGGLIASESASGSGVRFEDCSNSGSVSGYLYVGGFMGFMGDGGIGIYDSNNDGDVSGAFSAGFLGRAGYNSQRTTFSFTNSYNAGHVTSFGNAYIVLEASGTTAGTPRASGGMVGCLFTVLQITKCYNSGYIEADSFAGGLIGSINLGGCTIMYCFNLGDVVSYMSTASGIFCGNSGVTAGVNISYCYNAGNITADYSQYVSTYPMCPGYETKNCYYLENTSSSYNFAVNQVPSCTLLELSEGGLAYFLDQSDSGRLLTWGQGEVNGQSVPVPFDDAEPVYQVTLLEISGGSLSAEGMGVVEALEDKSTFLYSAVGKTITFSVSPHDESSIIQLLQIRNSLGKVVFSANSTEAENVELSMPETDIVISVEFGKRPTGGSVDVTLDANGGAFGVDKTKYLSVPKGSSLSMHEGLTPQRETLEGEPEWVFDGWYTDPSCSLASYFDPARLFLEETTITLYAGWRQAGIEIVFQLGSLSGFMEADADLVAPNIQYVSTGGIITKPEDNTLWASWDTFFNAEKKAFEYYTTTEYETEAVKLYTYLLEGWTLVNDGKRTTWDFSKPIDEIEEDTVVLTASWADRSSPALESNEKSPYVITSSAEFYALSQLETEFTGNVLELGADIDLPNGWERISRFNGKFINPHGYTITRKSDFVQGDSLPRFCERIREDGVIDGLNVINDVTGENKNGFYFSIQCFGEVLNCEIIRIGDDSTTLVGTNYGTVRNVVVNYDNATAAGNIVDTNYGTVAGCKLTGLLSAAMPVIAVTNNGSVQNCENSTEVKYTGNASTLAVGGIVRTNNVSGLVEDCIYSGSFEGAYRYIGGIVGTFSGGVVRNCETTDDAVLAGTYTVSGNYGVGGIIGYSTTTAANAPNSSVENCRNFADITSATRFAGGIIGYGIRVNVQGSSNYGTVRGSTYAAGISGYGGATNCVNYGTIIGVQGIGGILYQSGGTLGIDTECSGNKNMGELTNAVDDVYSSTSFVAVGGIMGLFNTPNASFTKNHNEGSINVTLDGAGAVGGLIGSSTIAVNTSISDSSVSADINISGNADNVGGLIGELTAVTQACSYEGKITVENAGNIGGLVGLNKSTIENSYAKTMIRVTGDESGCVGGLLGQNGNTPSVAGGVYDAYAIGSLDVNGGSRVGYIAGSNAENSILRNSYYYDTNGRQSVVSRGISESFGQASNNYYGATGWENGDSASSSQTKWLSAKAFAEGQAAYLLDGGSGAHRNTWSQDETVGLPNLHRGSYYRITVASASYGSLEAAWSGRTAKVGQALYVPVGARLTAEYTHESDSYELTSLSLGSKKFKGNTVTTTAGNATLSAHYVSITEPTSPPDPSNPDPTVPDPDMSNPPGSTNPPNSEEGGGDGNSSGSGSGTGLGIAISTVRGAFDAVASNRASPSSPSPAVENSPAAEETIDQQVIKDNETPEAEPVVREYLAEDVQKNIWLYVLIAGIIAVIISAGVIHRYRKNKAFGKRISPGVNC